MYLEMASKVVKTKFTEKSYFSTCVYTRYGTEKFHIKRCDVFGDSHVKPSTSWSTRIWRVHIK